MVETRSPVLEAVFGFKLMLDLLITGIVYYRASIALFWGLSFILFSAAVFFLVYRSDSRKGTRPNGLLQLLILDFVVSAAYGYLFIGGQVPNQLFVGITALAILMFAKNIRSLILTSVLLLVLYLTIMIGIDEYVFNRLDGISYFITCSFIIFAGIVSALLLVYRQARQDTLQLYDQLMESHERLQEYALKTEEWAAARERVTIARDIHDSVGHRLTGLLVQMQAARRLSTIDTTRSEQIYLECEELLRSSLQEIRLAVRSIREEPAHPAFLHDNLDKLSAEFSKFAQVETLFQTAGEPVRLPGELQLTVYRIVQECLTNAKKHGAADQAGVLLSYSAHGFSLKISNDGAVPSALTPGFGLLNMQERVKEWNGEVCWGKDDNMGFAVTVTIPYPAA